MYGTHNILLNSCTTSIAYTDRIHVFFDTLYHAYHLQDTQQIYHVISNQCLDCDPGSHEIFMNPCDKSAETQMWKVEHVHEDEVRKEWKAK